MRSGTAGSGAEPHGTKKRCCVSLGVFHAIFPSCTQDRVRSGVAPEIQTRSLSTFSSSTLTPSRIKAWYHLPMLKHRLIFSVVMIAALVVVFYLDYRLDRIDIAGTFLQPLFQGKALPDRRAADARACSWR